MARTITATEARVHFGDLLKRVTEDHETVIVERNGKSQVAVLPVDEYERLRASSKQGRVWEDELEDVLELVDRDLDHWRSASPTSSLQSAEDMIREMRNERDEELLGLR